LIRLQEILSNREISFLFWLVIIIIFLFFQKSMRGSLVGLLTLLLKKRFLAIYLTLSIYLLGIFTVLKAINLWTSADIKDSIFWLFSVALVLVFNLNKAKDSHYFKGILLDTIKTIALLEFIINFYNFGLVTELLLLPFLTFVITLQAYPDLDSKNSQVSKLLIGFTSIFGLVLLIYSIYQLTNGYSNFFKLGTLHSFLLPIILTVLFVPYLYFLSLYSIYESYFVTLDFMTVKKGKVKKAKKHIIRRANINLSRLNRIIEKFDKQVFYDDTNLKKYIKKISK
jgi:hypothetical protein